MTTPKDVAKWMRKKILSERELYQNDTVWEIEEIFGDDFVYTNENGNLAIDRRVLREFRKLTEDAVVWERKDRFWRLRDSYDEPGKRQID